MQKLIKSSVILFAIFIFLSCSGFQDDYQLAVDLTHKTDFSGSINGFENLQGEMIKVVTWPRPCEQIYKSMNALSGCTGDCYVLTKEETWVSLYSGDRKPGNYLRGLCSKDKRTTQLRFKQALGLDLSCRKNRLIVFMVPKKALRRPVYQIYEDQIKKQDASKMGLSIKEPSDSGGYPFTGAGYTYDWARKQNSPDQANENSFVGLHIEEFILMEGTEIYDPVEYLIEEFCQ